MTASWGRAALLLVLGGAAALLPQRFSRLLGQAPSRPETVKSVADELNEVLHARARDQESALARLPPEARQFLAETTPKIEILTNPVLERLLKMPAPHAGPADRPALAMGERLRAAGAEHGARLAAALKVAAASGLGLALLALMFGCPAAGRCFARLCHGLAGKWLWLLSLAGPAAFAGWRLDIWSCLPAQVWGVPAAALLVSAAVLRGIDLNAPVWNGTFSALLSPLLSCGAVLGCDRIAGWAQRLF